MAAEVTIDFSAFHNLTARASEYATQAMDLGLDVMASEAKALAPVGESGTLAQSIRRGPPEGSILTRDLRGDIIAATPYAEAQEFGSGVHGPKGEAYPIVPRFKRALRWPVQGSIPGGGPGFGFAKKVMHPGVQGQHFLERGVEAKLDTLGRELTAAIALALEEEG